MASRNYGLNIERELFEQDGSEYRLGSVTSDLIQIPPEERLKYLPEGERQDIGSEKMDCATRCFNNDLEVSLEWAIANKVLPLATENFLRRYYLNKTTGRIEIADRYTAIKSGTTAEGNSLKAPIQAIHEWGFVPKSMFPQVESFDEYYDASKITEEIEAIAKESKERLPVNYEKVLFKEFEEVLKKDMLSTGLFAWTEPSDGYYPAVQGNSPNHAVLIVKPKWFVFDNYFDGDFIKQLSPSYELLGYGYRVIINQKPPVIKKKNWLEELLRNLLDFILFR